MVWYEFRFILAPLRTGVKPIFLAYSRCEGITLSVRVRGGGKHRELGVGNKTGSP